MLILIYILISDKNLVNMMVMPRFYVNFRLTGSTYVHQRRAVTVKCDAMNGYLICGCSNFLLPGI